MASVSEPIVRLVVVTPTRYVGQVVGELNTRRARILDVVARADAGAHFVVAWVLRVEMDGYGAQLHLLTQGRASHLAQFSHWSDADAPPEDLAAAGIPLKPRPPTRSAGAAAKPADDAQGT